MEKLPVLNPGIQPDPWSSLRKLTAARIALGNTGGVIPLQQVLAIRMAHAHARDAVYAQLDETYLLGELKKFRLPLIRATSSSRNRDHYLLDPGSGRKLDLSSIVSLQGEVAPGGVALIVSDGLSATAANAHAIPLLKQLIPQLLQAGSQINSLTLVQGGRVALSDAIGAWSGADMTIMLLGERPGLTAADSLGVYLTYNARPGLTDESRNCVSNIHHGGLSYAAASSRIIYLVNMAFQHRQSGVMLKEQDELPEQ